jgi:hypothetical protein
MREIISGGVLDIPDAKARGVNCSSISVQCPRCQGS